MTDTLLVLLYGQRIGELARDGQRLTIRYEDAYRDDPDATPLSLSMPLGVATHSTKVVEPWLWGLLPDNQDVLDRWSRDYQVSARNVFALLSHVGEDCAGAVQFVRPERLEDLSRGRVDWLSDADVATLIRNLRVDPTAWHAAAGTGQFSLAGAQAKTALHFDGLRWGLPSGSIPTTHILKPAIEGRSEHELNEHLCLTAARLAGLAAAYSEVRSFNDERVIVVERYDRRFTPSGVQRVHQEDMCQALSVHPDRKYQSDGGPTPAQMAALFRSATPRRQAAELTRGFVDALALNWLIAGTDAHAKNYSVLLLRGDVRLAPLYDVASALPYQDLDRHHLRLAMKVGRTYELSYISRENWTSLANEVELPAEQVLQRVDALARRLPAAFQKACADPLVRELGSSLPNQVLGEVTERIRECQSRLEGSEAGKATRVLAKDQPSSTPSPALDGASAWTSTGASQLLAELAPPQARLIEALVEAGGTLAASQVKEALGRSATASLRGLTGPISKATKRLVRRGILDPSATTPVRATYNGEIKAAAFEIEDDALRAFRSLADRDVCDSSS
jgi:serine/threonine-protein kinase HipA